MRNSLLLTFCVLLLRFGYAQSEGWAICNSGANLYFKIVGSGTNTLLVVSDAGNSSAYMKDLVERLAQTNRVVFYDARATGKSRLPTVHDTTVNFNKAVADIEALRMVLRIPKWSVVAHGFGANIACAYTSQVGKTVGQLVLINPASFHHKSPDKLEEIFDTYEDYDFSKMLTQESINHRFVKLQKHLQTPKLDSAARAKAIMAFQAATYVYDTLHEPIATEFLYEKIKNITVKNRVNGKFIINSADCLATLHTLSIPTMVVLSKPRQGFNALLKAWKKGLPTAQLVTIDKAHHFPWLDNPVPFYGHLVPFLQKPLTTELYVSQKKVSRPVGRGNQRRKRY
jgi:proline iminopeptidase